MAKKAIFTGTFDPFTRGHASVVERALPLFDTVVIGVAVSEAKHTAQTVEQRLQNIRELYRDEPRVEVKAYSQLTVDFAAAEQASCIVRGVRSVKDFEYERQQAEINRMIGGIETLLLVAEPHLANVSSSIVRELQAFGRDVSEFLPEKKA